jgi:hypothetical protein
MGFPTGTAPVAGTSGVEAETCDGHENMAVTDINRDPLAFTFFAIGEESF